jgi:hypothetical protein
VTRGGVASEPRKATRYYVLEVLEAVKNELGDPEPRSWVVVSESIQNYEAAWQAAAESRARNPGKAYIAGELIPQYLPS